MAGDSGQDIEITEDSELETPVTAPEETPETNGSAPDDSAPDDSAPDGSAPITRSTGDTALNGKTLSALWAGASPFIAGVSGNNTAGAVNVAQREKKDTRNAGASLALNAYSARLDRERQTLVDLKIRHSDLVSRRDLLQQIMDVKLDIQENETLRETLRTQQTALTTQLKKTMLDIARLEREIQEEYAKIEEDRAAVMAELTEAKSRYFVLRVPTGAVSFDFPGSLERLGPYMAAPRAIVSDDLICVDEDGNYVIASWSVDGNGTKNSAEIKFVPVSEYYSDLDNEAIKGLIEESGKPLISKTDLEKLNVKRVAQIIDGREKTSPLYDELFRKFDAASDNEERQAQISAVTTSIIAELDAKTTTQQTERDRLLKIAKENDIDITNSNEDLAAEIKALEVEITKSKELIAQVENQTKLLAYLDSDNFREQFEISKKAIAENNNFDPEKDISPDNAITIDYKNSIAEIGLDPQSAAELVLEMRDDGIIIANPPEDVKTAMNDTLQKKQGINTTASGAFADEVAGNMGHASKLDNASLTGGFNNQSGANGQTNPDHRLTFEKTGDPNVPPSLTS